MVEDTNKDDQIAKTFLALDLEMNQPSGKIIQVGVAIGSPNQTEKEFRTGLWHVEIDEPLSQVIVDLTGITDGDLAEKGVSLVQCATELSAMIDGEKPFHSPVTWGGGDSAALLSAFKAEDAEFRHFGRRWIDVKTLYQFHRFADPTGPKSVTGGLKSAMGKFKLPFTGYAHRADVDANNTLKFFFALIKRQRAMEHGAHLMREAGR